MCVALAHARQTGAHHCIQMWGSFGEPVPISRTQLPFHPPPLPQILELRFEELRLGNCNYTRLEPRQVVDTARVVTPLQSKTSPTTCGEGIFMSR